MTPSRPGTKGMRKSTPLIAALSLLVTAAFVFNQTTRRTSPRTNEDGALPATDETREPPPLKPGEYRLIVRVLSANHNLPMSGIVVFTELGRKKGLTNKAGLYEEISDINLEGYKVAAIVPGREDGHGSYSVRIPPVDNGIHRVEIRFPDLYRIHGRITDMDGRPLDGSASADWIDREKQKVYSARGIEDEEGRYQIWATIPSGMEVELSAGAEGHYMKGERPKFVAAGNEWHQDLRLERKKYIKVLVVDESGDPISGARVVYWRKMESLQVGSGLPEITDKNGKAKINATGGGELWLSAIADEYRRTVYKTTVVANAVESYPPFKLQLQPGRPIERQILTPDGKPVAHRRIVLKPDLEFGIGRDVEEVVLTDGKGRFTTMCLTPGWTYSAWIMEEDPEMEGQYDRGWEVRDFVASDAGNRLIADPQ